LEKDIFAVEKKSTTWFPGPTRVLNPKGISIASAVFAGLTSVTDRLTDRPTDHATRSVTIDRIYVPTARSVASPAWVRRPAARRIHLTF